MGRVSIVVVVWLTDHCQTKGFAAFQKNQALDQALDFGFPIVKRLFQQLQHALWNLVGLRHHGGTCLLQDLCAREIRSFGGEVGILNA